MDALPRTYYDIRQEELWEEISQIPDNQIQTLLDMTDIELYNYAESILENFGNYMNTLGFSHRERAQAIAAVSQASVEELKTLDYVINLPMLPEWAFSTNQHYWLGTSAGIDGMACVFANGKLKSDGYVNNFGIRPVIVIQTSNIKVN